MPKVTLLQHETYDTQQILLLVHNPSEMRLTYVSIESSFTVSLDDD